MQKPDLKEFVPKTKAKAEEVNYNFEQMNDYVGGTADELKALVNSAIANINLQLTQNIITGEIKTFAGTTIPSGWLLCDGSAVSRETYKNLYNVIGVKYGAGNGETTFNLPNYIGKFLEGGTQAGIVKEAALPNITGQFGASNVGEAASVPTTGALRNTAIGVGRRVGGLGECASNLSIDASLSSPIYKNDCKTVQPPAVTVLYIIKT